MDASTEGMKGGGYYDLHSEYQRRIIEGGDGLIASAAASLRAAAADSVGIADYGCGTGAGSVHAIRTAISAVPDRGDRPVVAIHNDVITNDFNQVFSAVAAADGYLDLGPVYPLAVAGSFFDQVVPDRSVDLGLCSNAAHWFREQPRVEIADGIYHADARGEAREALASEAAADWVSFLDARSAELRPGGRLIVQGIASTDVDGTERVSASRLLHAMWSIADALADEGRLDRATLAGYTFPVYCRSVDELVAPVAEGGPLGGRLEVFSTAVEEVANPYWEAYERDRDATAYAEVYVQFVRAFAESSLMLGLFEPGAVEESAAELCDRFFAQLQDAVAATPDESRYEAWVARVVFARGEGG